jgi:hypothetical protein
LNPGDAALALIAGPRFRAIGSILAIALREWPVMDIRTATSASSREGSARRPGSSRH